MSHIARFVSPYATSVSVFAALFIGFLQLSGFWLLPLTMLSVLGMRFYHPEQFKTWFEYARSSVVAFICLAILEWLARLASLYVTGYQFVGRVE
jgi:hypothetical protein